MTAPEGSVDISRLPIFADPPPLNVTGTQNADQHASTAPEHAPATGPDWAQVRAFRQKAAARLAEQVNENTSEHERRAVGHQIIAQILDEHVRRAVTSGASALGIDDQAVMAHWSSMRCSGLADCNLSWTTRRSRTSRYTEQNRSW